MNLNIKPFSKNKIQPPLHMKINPSQTNIDNSNKTTNTQNKPKSINNQIFFENEIELHRYGHSITLSKLN